MRLCVKASHGHMLKNPAPLDLLDFCISEALKNCAEFLPFSEWRRANMPSPQKEASIKLAVDELHLKCIRLIPTRAARNLIHSAFAVELASYAHTTQLFPIFRWAEH